MSEPTIEQRLGALENQAYIMYLQLNALTKIIVNDKELVSQEELTAEMDSLNQQIQEMSEEMAAEAAGEKVEE
jgi:hypothetical protein